MPDFWLRLRAPLAFAALAGLAAITMVLDRPGPAGVRGELPWWQGLWVDIAVPVQKVLRAPADAVGDVWVAYVDLIAVRNENDLLRERIAELEDANLQFREALVASGNLQQIAQMRDDYDTPMLPSEIVGLDVSPWFRSVLLDRGSSHEVVPGNPVITSDGVVGLVTSTSSHAAKSMLLLDRQSAIDGIVQRSRARGIVRGTGRGELEFEFVVRGSDVQSGDVVITSGMGGIYPKGLRIGVVDRVADPGGRLVQTAMLRPAVDFGRLEQVFVMLRRGPTMELLYGAERPSTESGAPDLARAPSGRPSS